MSCVTVRTRVRFLSQRPGLHRAVHRAVDTTIVSEFFTLCFNMYLEIRCLKHVFPLNAMI